MYWPVLLGAATLAVLVPWYTGLLDVDLQPTLRMLLTGGVASVLILRWTPPSAGAALRSLPYLISVVVIGVVWFSVGASAASGFLVLFVLPVFASALASKGWLEYAVATFTVATVWTTAIVSDPGVHWYVLRLGLIPDWLDGEPQDAIATTATPSDSLANVVALIVFAVTVFSVAFIGSMAARALRWMESRLDSTARSLDEREALVKRLTSATSTLRLCFVNPATGRILAESGSGGQEDTLFDLLEPAFPEELAGLIESEEGGVLEARVCRLDDQPRIVDIAVDPAQLDGESVRRVTVRETAGVRLAAQALDDMNIGILVLGPDRRVLFSSCAFVALFPAASSAATASAALDDVHGLPAGWWDVAPARRGSIKFMQDEKGYSVDVLRTVDHGADALILLHLCEEPRP